MKEEVAAPAYKTETDGRRDSMRWPRNTLSLPAKVDTTSQAGRLGGKVRLQTNRHGNSEQLCGLLKCLERKTYI